MFIFHYDSCLCSTVYNDTVGKLDVNKNLSFSLDIIANKLKKEITTTANEELGIELIKVRTNQFPIPLE